jgi:hypothetical protein
MSTFRPSPWRRLLLATLSGLSPASAFRKPNLEDMKELAAWVRWMSHRFEYFHNSAYTDPFQLLLAPGDEPSALVQYTDGCHCFANELGSSG